MKSLLDLNKRDCRWPMTDDKPFLFCGEAIVEGSSYCACHRRASLSADQPRAQSGRELSAIANIFGGGRARDVRKAGGEKGRPAVDTLFVMARNTQLARDFFPEDAG